MYTRADGSGRTVTDAERELGRGMDTLHKDLWLTLDHQLRVKTIQKIPDCEL